MDISPSRTDNCYNELMPDQADSETKSQIEIPLTEWQLGVEDAGARLKGRVRHCSRNAFEHLRKSWRLIGLDNEMAAFRAITAEEEASTALIHALKIQGYPGADRLRPRDHVHKSAFWPLIEAVNRTLARSNFVTPKVALSRRGDPKVRIKLNVTQLAGHDGDPLWAEPDHPLDFALRVGDAPGQAVHFFEEELEELAKEGGKSSIATYVEKRANERNRLLYASDEGIPGAILCEKSLLECARRVSVLIFVTIMIMQTTEKQLFAVQCLEALLRALQKFGGLAFDYSRAEVATDRPILTINRTGEAAGQMAIRTPLAPQRVWWGSLGYSRAGVRPYSLDLSYSRALPEGQRRTRPNVS